MRVTTHSETIKPFYSIIKEIQAKRKEYPKGHVLNLLYKEMGYSIYGTVVRGCRIRKLLTLCMGKLLEWLLRTYKKNSCLLD